MLCRTSWISCAATSASDKPYPTWALSNNNAEIRRVKERIASLTKKNDTPFVGWEFDGGKVEANKADNRLQIFFDDKPDADTRAELKSGGFRWSPNAGAWQRQLNSNAYYAANGISAIQPLTGEKPTDLQRAYVREQQAQPEATPDSLMTGETIRTPRGNFYITDMSREQMEAAGYGFHHASDDGKYLIMGNGTRAFAIAAEQPQRDNPLKTVEQTVEQNDNMIDGIINNTPGAPTVTDLEQRAKAGEAISVTDLAKAVQAEKREQPQKKPSILKKLDEYKKQAAQQPQKQQKEQKKDLEV